MTDSIAADPPAQPAPRTDPLREEDPTPVHDTDLSSQVGRLRHLSASAVPLVRRRGITVTADEHRVFAHHESAASAAVVPAPAAPVAIPARGARR